jgi:hypothetical protein
MSDLEDLAQIEQIEIQPVKQVKGKKDGVVGETIGFPTKKPRTEAQLNATKRMLEAKAQKREEEIKIKAEELLKQKEIENKLKAKLETKILKKAVKLTNKKVNQKAIANEILDDSDDDSEIQKPIKRKPKPEPVNDSNLGVVGGVAPTVKETPKIAPSKPTEETPKIAPIPETPKFTRPVLKRNGCILLSDFLTK